MGGKEIKPCLGMFELCFNKSINRCKQPCVSLLLSAFVPRPYHRNGRTDRLTGWYLRREIVPSTITSTSHKNKSILVSTARSQQDFSVTLWKELFSFLTIAEMRLFSLQNLPFMLISTELVVFKQVFPSWSIICVFLMENSIFSFSLAKLYLHQTWV